MNADQQPPTKQFLFSHDPARFIQVVETHDFDARIDALGSDLEEIGLCEIVRYGRYNDPEMIKPLGLLYSEVIVPKVDQQRRYEMYRFINEFAFNVPGVTMNMFMPFITKEPVTEIVAGAVLDYVSYGGPTPDKQLGFAAAIVELIRMEGAILNVGAAFGGLLHLGDVEVCRLLYPLRDDLDHSAVQAMVRSVTGFTCSPTIEFLLDWLEGLDGDVVDGIFALVAAMLANEAIKNVTGVVYTGERRQFPIPREASGDERRTRLDLARPLPMADYAARIASRLYALERSEPPPRVMPDVLKAWALEPTTDMSESARSVRN